MTKMASSSWILKVSFPCVISLDRRIHYEYLYCLICVFVPELKKNMAAKLEGRVRWCSYACVSCGCVLSCYITDSVDWHGGIMNSKHNYTNTNIGMRITRMQQSCNLILKADCFLYFLFIAVGGNAKLKSHDHNNMSQAGICFISFQS